MGEASVLLVLSGRELEVVFDLHFGNAKEEKQKNLCKLEKKVHLLNGYSCLRRRFTGGPTIAYSHGSVKTTLNNSPRKLISYNVGHIV